MARGDGSSGGSFREDLDWLLAELSKPPVMELGKPEPQEKHLPARSAAKSPAEHNRILIDGVAGARRQAR